MTQELFPLPPNLPVPEDDGAADHLLDLELPDLVLESSQGGVNVREVDVLYVYPRAGRPGRDLLPGWDETPGARGCTPQSCAFRDLYPELGVPAPASRLRPSTTSRSSGSGTGCRFPSSLIRRCGSAPPSICRRS